jgi:hypothetical protein
MREGFKGLRFKGLRGSMRQGRTLRRRFLTVRREDWRIMSGLPLFLDVVRAGKGTRASDPVNNHSAGSKQDG